MPSDRKKEHALLSGIRGIGQTFIVTPCFGHQADRPSPQQVSGAVMGATDAGRG
jgi:hypothetical protein